MLCGVWPGSEKHWVSSGRAWKCWDLTDLLCCLNLKWCLCMTGMHKSHRLCNLVYQYASDYPPSPLMSIYSDVCKGPVGTGGLSDLQGGCCGLRPNWQQDSDTQNTFSHRYIWCQCVTQSVRPAGGQCCPEPSGGDTGMPSHQGCRWPLRACPTPSVSDGMEAPQFELSQLPPMTGDLLLPAGAQGKEGSSTRWGHAPP